MSDKIGNNDNSELNIFSKKIANLDDKVNEIFNNITSLGDYSKIQSSIQNIITNIGEIQNNIQEIKSINSQANKIKNNIENNSQKINQTVENTEQLCDEINTKINSFNIQFEKEIEIFNSNINSSEDIISEVKVLNNESLELNENIKSIYTSATSLQNKITQIHKDSLEYRNQISDLYDEIYGYEYKDTETDELIQEKGLKHKLEDSYKQLEQEEERLSKIINDTIEKLKTDTDDKLTKFMDIQKNKYENLFAKIENLLPSALTAGLASAYREKRINEEEILNISNKKFICSIAIAMIVALIPVLVSFFILKNIPLDEIILYIPKFMTFLIPIYIPIIWLAAHFNKQIKLSKRLIEEYTHKEVLNKTFEGLAKQIDQLENTSSENYNELRSKLLYNIIEMTSHNPGQLIKGFEHTDHPLIEVLNKIIQSEDSLKKLQNMPGISIIINRLQSRINKEKEQIDKDITDLNQDDIDKS